MNDEIIGRFILMRVRPGELVILTRRSDRIQRSLGSLSEDVVKYLNKFLFVAGGMSTAAGEAAWLGNSRD